MANPANAVEALEYIVGEHRKDPTRWIEDVFFKEGGVWFEMDFIAEDEETRPLIAGYVKISSMGVWLDSNEFSLEESRLEALREWVSEVVWDHVTK